MAFSNPLGPTTAQSASHEMHWTKNATDTAVFHHCFNMGQTTPPQNDQTCFFVLVRRENLAAYTFLERNDSLHFCTFFIILLSCQHKLSPHYISRASFSSPPVLRVVSESNHLAKATPTVKASHQATNAHAILVCQMRVGMAARDRTRFRFHPAHWRSNYRPCTRE